MSNKVRLKKKKKPKAKKGLRGAPWASKEDLIKQNPTLKKFDPAGLRGTLNVASGRILMENPDLAGAMEADLAEADNREKLDPAETNAINKAFVVGAGQPTTIVSMASQYRHPDWKHNKGVTAKPTGKTLTLHHFTSRIHLPVMLEYGITRGDVPVDISDQSKNFNAPWFTIDESFDEQKWAEDEKGNPNAVFDKREVRVTVELPLDEALHHWPVWAKELEVPAFWFRALDTTGGQSSADWYIYNGHVPVSWITRIDYREGSKVIYDRVGSVKSLELDA